MEVDVQGVNSEKNTTEITFKCEPWLAWPIRCVFSNLKEIAGLEVKFVNYNMASDKARVPKKKQNSKPADPVKGDGKESGKNRDQRRKRKRDPKKK